MSLPRTNRLGAVLYALCKEANTGFSLGIWLRFKYKDISLLETECDPRSYDDLQEFRSDWLCFNYARKCIALPVRRDTAKAAITNWKESEERCSKTNHRLRDFRKNPKFGPEQGYISVALQLISKVLGEVSSVRTVDCGWGPGATASLMGSSVRLDMKLLEQELSVTPRSFILASHAIGEDVPWVNARGIPADGPVCLLKSEFRFQEWNRFVTVPKDCKTDRPIAAEPTANIFLQKAVGSYIRRRLKKFGCNLNDQTINQAFAQKAYCANYSTIDLTSASDTLSLETVRDLLPYDWFCLLDALRCHQTRFGKDEVPVSLSKFSSMGNGFTFELESLIFWALSKAVSPGLCSVYGDDIIVPAHHYTSLCHLLTYYGFLVNEKKSFHTGNFFESCGRHFFRGHEVTPIFQKTSVASFSEQVIAHNRLWRWCQREYMLYQCFPRTLRAALRLLRWGSRVDQPMGFVGDRGFIRENFSPHRLSDDQWSFKTVGLTARQERLSLNQSAALAYSLRFNPTEPIGSGVASRSNIGFKLNCLVYQRDTLRC